MRAEDRESPMKHPPDRAESLDELAVQAGYAAWAPLYDDDGNPLTALEGPAVRAWFGLLEGRRAIDVGCGTGRHTEALLAAGAVSVVALDLTPEMIVRARAKLAGRPVQWLRHSLPDPLPFRDASFDLAVVGLVAEHIERVAPALAEVARVLTRGGRCVLSALHPERTAEGQRARFIDPKTGLRRPVKTFHHTKADYLAAATAARLVLEGEQSLVVPTELAAILPRSRPYLGLNLGWVACWTRP
jgi:malonyl-CoA O-methyltransferase